MVESNFLQLYPNLYLLRSFMKSIYEIIYEVYQTIYENNLLRSDMNFFI